MLLKKLLKRRKRGNPLSHYGYLQHHGIQGQRWGIRRYQNEDGSLTALGRRYYGVQERRALKEQKKQYLADNKVRYKEAKDQLREFNKDPKNLFKNKERKALKENIKEIKTDRFVAKTRNDEYRKMYMEETDPEKKRQLGELIKAADANKAAKDMFVLHTVGNGAEKVGKSAIRSTESVVKSIGKAVAVPVMIFAGKMVVDKILSGEGVDLQGTLDSTKDYVKDLGFIKDKLPNISGFINKKK